MTTGICGIGDNLQLLCSAAAADAAGDTCGTSKSHILIVRQQPERSRVGSISEKVDRRPIDPPPIIQLVIRDPLDPNASSYTTSPAFFMQTTLMDASGQTPVRFLKGNKAAAMAGPMVCPLHTLRDESSKQGAYFVFSDLSVRLEGTFRLRFDLFEITGDMVERRATVVSGTFSVYSPKRFPGMMSSTKLSKLFAEQGLRIRIRSEEATKKRNRKAVDKSSTNETNGPPLKRARHVGSTQSLMAPNNASLLAAPNSSPAASFRSGGYPLHADAAGISSTVFQSNSFAAHRGDKENVPPGGYWQDLQPKGMFRLDKSDFAQSQSLNPSRSSMLCLQKPGYDIGSRAESSLSFSDIAAVALLDSLSSGNRAGCLRTAKDISPPLITNAEIDRILSPEVCLDQSYSRGYSASSSVPLESVVINRVNTSSQHTQQQQQHQILPAMGSFDSMTNLYAATSVCMPYTSYRIVPSSRTPDSIFGTRTFVDTAPRMHPILRSSSTRMNGNGNGNGVFDLSSAPGNAATASDPVSQILQLPQRQYSSASSATSWINTSIPSAAVMAIPKHSHVPSSCTGYAGSLL